MREYADCLDASRSVRGAVLVALSLVACAALPPIDRDRRTQVPVAVVAPVARDPVYPPCPMPGWLTAETLVGAWNVLRWGEDGLQAAAERHDYLPDGTLRTTELRWPVLPRAELEALTGGPWVGLLTRFETREEGAGTWSVDASGVREQRWTAGDTTRVIRGRVWVQRGAWRGPHATLHRRPLRLGADGVWRGEELGEWIGPGGPRGVVSRIEMRFQPRLGSAGDACSVEIFRHLRVWGDGTPTEWTDRARHDCSFEGEYIRLFSYFDVVRPPASDLRLKVAFEMFGDTQVQRAAPDALLIGGYTRDQPETRARAAEPPISRYDVRGIGFCTPDQPLAREGI